MVRAMVIPQLTGRSAPAFNTVCLLDALEDRATSNQPWLTFHETDTPFTVRASDVVTRAQHWARAFVDAEIGPNAAVGIWYPNSFEFVAAFFGAHGAGAVPVPLAWPVIDGQLETAYQRLEPLLAGAGIRHVAAAPRAHQPHTDTTWVTARPSGTQWLARPRADDTAFVQLTSGSTRAPRGVVISHRAALENAHALVAGLRLTAGDVGVSWVPFFHDMGLVGVLLASLVGGFEVHVLRPGTFLMHPWRWLELIERTQATLTVSPDFGYSFASRRCASKSLSLASLRCALSGSEPVQLGTLDAFEGRFCPDGFRPEAWVSAYGLAENTLGVSIGHPRAAQTMVGAHCIPTVGTPLPGVEIGLEPSGEICVRSPSLFSGYLNAPAQTALTLVDGWLHTGDVGTIENGRLFIVGREKEMVIHNGTKFQPTHIEQLVAHTVDAPPNGVVVFNCLNRELVLVIEQRRRSGPADSNRIRALIVDQLGVRVDRIEWVPAGTLPRTTSGKLRRTACAAQFGAS